MSDAPSAPDATPAATRSSSAASTRERIVDALEAVLLAHGPAGATLEAVAERAGVSKGGLLYHFRGKDELFDGLFDRLTAQAAAAVGSPGDADAVVRRFLEGSQEADGAETRSLLAALQLVGSYGPAAGRLALYLDDWAAELRREIEDPALARLVQLVGDGMFLHALLGAGKPGVDADVVALVLDVVRERRAR